MAPCGWAFFDPNGLRQAVERIMQHGSNYYTIAYATSAKQMDGQFRKIQIQLDDKNYQLAYRSGYYADDSRKRFAFRSSEPSLVAAAVHGAPTASEVLFTVRVTPSSSPSTGPLKRYTFDFNLDPHSLTLNPAGDGSSRAQVEFIVIAYDADGKRLKYNDVGFAFRVGADQYPAAMHSGIPKQTAVEPPPGRVSLRVGVHDLLSNRFGSIEFPLSVRVP